jgi:hypothetical protein
MRSVRTIVALPFIALLGACADTPAPITGELEHTMSAAVVPPPVNISAAVFGLSTTFDGHVFAAETFVGVTQIGPGGASPFASLQGVTGVAVKNYNTVFAVTGGGFGPPSLAQKLYRVTPGNAALYADLGAFESAVNPDQIWNTGPPDSNPFNVALLPNGKVLVADAAGNDILIVDEFGRVDWVAVLTPRLVSTIPFKRMIGCPGSGAPECGLPERIPAQPVATSIAVGPDGYWYAGELTGFPAQHGVSRIWKIPQGSRHVVCPSAQCTLFADGFTSIMSLAFGPDGTLYVVEFDEGGWLAVEIAAAGGPLRKVEGGTLNACNIATGACTAIATKLSLPAAVTVDRSGTVWIAENDRIPGTARVHPIP